MRELRIPMSMYSQCQRRWITGSSPACLGFSGGPPLVTFYPSGFSIHAHEGFHERFSLFVADLRVPFCPPPPPSLAPGIS